MLTVDPSVAEWVYEPFGGAITPTTSALGWVSDGKLTAGASVEGWNGVNAYIHLRVEGQAPKVFWVCVADWVFNQLGCKRVTAPIGSFNDKAIRLSKKVGFEHEATLKKAAFNESDLHFMVLWKDKCRILNWSK